jgi:alkyldihydroxyacetonephosphate synthase
MPNNNYKMKWWGWGNKDKFANLENYLGIKTYLNNKFSIKNLQNKKKFSIEDIIIPNSKMPSNIVSKFIKLLGKERVFQCKKERIIHTFGKSYKDSLKIRSNKIDIAPDLVIYPESEEEIKSIFLIAKTYQIAIVPFGGGTSVVGGLDAKPGQNKYVLSLDLTRLNKIIKIDKQSRTALIEAGKFGPEIEEELKQAGLTLGHYPQSFEFSTLGGWIAARSSGQNSILFGGIESLVIALKMVSPNGEVHTIHSPRMATGPDFKEIILGSEGSLGVITKALVKISPIPERQEYNMYVFKNFQEAKNAAKDITQNKIPVAMIRVSNEDETEAFFAMGKSKKTFLSDFFSKIIKKYMRIKNIDPKCCSTMLVGFEGNENDILINKEKITKLFSNYSQLSLGTKPGKKWLKDRFFLPYIRDEFMDNDLLIDTLETSTTWNRLDELYKLIKKAIHDSIDTDKVIIYTHLSHFYNSGASLYVTIVALQNTENPILQWQNMKEKVNKTLKEFNAPISHHHGVGIDHKDGIHWSNSEQLLMQNLKDQFDPNGIMNPGKLL